MKLRTTILLVLMISVASPAQAAKLYKWIDANGNATYQDRPPPEGVITYAETKAAEPRATSTDGAAPPVEITLYGIEECEPCGLTQAYLTEKTLPFSERNPETDPQVAAEMMERFGAAEVPIVVINGEIVRGHNPLWIDSVVAKTTQTAQ